MIFDIVARDAKGRDVLLVTVVHGMKLTGEHLFRIFFEEMSSTCPGVPFGMAVDSEFIHVQNLHHPEAPESTCQLSRLDVFSHYDPEVRTKRVFPPYIVGLLEAWLRDLAFGRQLGHGEPPGSKELAAMGLLERVRGGMPFREVSIGEDAVC